MRLSEAIEILKTYNQHLDIAIEPGLVNAQNLGIEALRQVKLMREDTHIGALYQLPGETED